MTQSSKQRRLLLNVQQTEPPWKTVGHEEYTLAELTQTTLTKLKTSVQAPWASLPFLHSNAWFFAFETKKSCL